MNYIDLHTHSDCSDGELSPSELIIYALERGIKLLAITDHDNVDAYQKVCHAEKKDSNQPYIKTSQDLFLLSGIELSSSWKGNGIHIVGLGININNPYFADFVCKQKERRINRLQSIAIQLESMDVKGIQDFIDLIVRQNNNQVFGRKHFADFIVKSGQAKDFKQAFKRFLSDDKLIKMPSFWPDINESINIIGQAGGLAVLAHPLKYKLSRFKTNQLIADFVAAGGQSIEVASSMQNQESTDYLYSKCQEHNLLASVGSDFHQTELVWQDVGKFNYLTPHVSTVMSHWPELSKIQTH